jgi:glutamyl-tRNA synthetase
MQYDEDGFLPEPSSTIWPPGLVARRRRTVLAQQFVEWFDLDHITASAAQFNTEKLLWLNQHYMKQPPAELAAKVRAAWQHVAST